MSFYVPARRRQHLVAPLDPGRQRDGPGPQRVEHRRPQPVEAIVGVGLLRPLVDQLGEAIASGPTRVEVVEVAHSVQGAAF